MFGNKVTATYIVTAVCNVVQLSGYHSPLACTSLADTLVSALHYIWHARRIIERRGMKNGAGCCASAALVSGARCGVLGAWCLVLVLRLCAGGAEAGGCRNQRGAFVIDLAGDAAPNRLHFMKVAAEGGYDGTIFHRVVKYGMVQGGDPLTRDPDKRSLYGTGGLNVVKGEARAPKMTRGSVAAVTIA
jgi:hypothetical protein